MPRIAVRNIPASLALTSSPASNVLFGVVPSLQLNTFSVAFKVLPMVRNYTVRSLYYTNVGSTAGVEIRIGVFDNILLVKNSITVIMNNTTKKINTFNWNDIVLTYDSTSGVCNLYLNGTLFDTSTNAVTFTHGTIGIGTPSSAIDKVSDYRVFSRVLTSTEVDSLYSNPSSNPTNLVAWWKMDEGAGTVVTDSSGNGNNGTITNATYTSDTPSKARKEVDGNLVHNGDFSYIPPTLTPQTGNAWIDGTASGTTINPPIFGWRKYSNDSSHTANFTALNELRVTSAGGINAYSWVGSDRNVASGDPTTTTLRENGIILLPDTSYTLSSRAKTDATFAAGQASIVLDQHSLVGGAPIVANSMSLTSATTSYTNFSITFTTNSSTRYCAIKISNGAIGVTSVASSLILDNIDLRPTTSTTRLIA